MTCLVTGATGFVGGHVADRLIDRGIGVRTIARAESDTGRLSERGVEICQGSLTDPRVIRDACKGVKQVIHCAAKLGDWGPIDEYRKVNVEAFEHLLRACLDNAVERIVLVSSLGVYRATDHHGTDETAPLPERHIDAYTQTKVEADRLALRYFRERQAPVVLVRPGFIYGPRDRTVLPRILVNLKRGLVTYFGSREKKINNTYVGNLVDAIGLAMDKPDILGEAFNVTDAVCVSKREFFETVAELAGLPKPHRKMPMWLARGLCSGMETAGRLFGFAPVLNSARLKFMGLNLDYSIAKARTKLGYQPAVDFPTGMRTTIDWFRQEKLIP